MSGVLYVIDGLQFGGGERGFLSLIQGALAAGWPVAVATHPAGRFAAEARALGAELRPLPLDRRHALGAVRRLRRWARTGPWAVVHSQGARADLVARLALAGVGGVSLVSTVQMPVDGFDVGPLRRAAYRRLDRLGRGRVDRFVVVSAALQRTLVSAWRLDPARVRLIPNGVAVDRTAPPRPAALRRLLGVESASAVVGAVGRLVRQKGFDTLLAALPALLARRPGTRLAVVGEGPERESLARLARARGAGEAVVFAGFRPDAPRLLPAFDVLAVPSRREGAPLVTLEAMAAGVPVVASAIRGIDEQITDGVEGLLVPPDDPPALAAALARVLDDRALAARLGEAGRRRVRAAYDVRDTVARTLALYHEVAGAPWAAVGPR